MITHLRILSLLTNAFPLWVLLASGLSLVWPGLFTWFSGPLIPVGLTIIMLSMGMTVGFEDFRRIARQRNSVVSGLVLQYTLMPGLGWSLAALFDLPTPFAIGLILVSCCPGGTASNVISFLARADVALSVSMTVTSTLLSALMTPTLTALLAGNRVAVSIGRLVLDTVHVVILPVIGGAFLKWRFPSISRRILPVAPLIAVLAITLIVASIIGATRQSVVEAGFRLVGAVFTLHASGFVLGYIFGWFWLKRESASRTISIEVGMQNSALGVVLAQQNFSNPLVALPCAISAVFHSLLGSLVAAVWRTKPDTQQTRIT